MKYIELLPIQAGDIVCVRTDYNVPTDNHGRVTESLRIDSSIKTLTYLEKLKAKIVILAHIGDENKESLLPVFDYIKEQKFNNILWYKGQLHSQSFHDQIKAMNNGDILLCENIRMQGELKNENEFYGYEKENDRHFCETVSKNFQWYINECFSVSHRKHASTYGIPMMMTGRCAAGYQTMTEVDSLSKMHNPEHPFVLIQGGVKILTKLPILEMLVPKVDQVLLAGALLNTLLHAKGNEVGVSVFEDIQMPEILSHAISDKKIIIPEFVKVKNKKGEIVEKNIDMIEESDYIGDMTHHFIDTFIPYMENAKLILFNGALGDTTKPEFEDGTKYILNKLNEYGEKVIIGGGDTSAFVKKCLPTFKGFLSTGGGATLDFIAKGNLPCLLILTDNN